MAIGQGDVDSDQSGDRVCELTRQDIPEISRYSMAVPKRTVRQSSKRPRGQGETSALYVRIPAEEAAKLDRASFALKAHKRDLIAALVARYVDPSSPRGLEELRALGAHDQSSSLARIPEPTEPQPRRPTPPAGLTVQVSRAGSWVAGLRRSISEFARARHCPSPLVRVTLDDGEQLFLQGMTPGPDDDFATFSVYPLVDDAPRLVVVRIDAIKKIEMLGEPPDAAEQGFVFPVSEAGVGFVGAE
jgi:hypothetical protein